MVGHVTVAVTQQIDLKIYPTVKRIFETAMALPEFAKGASAGAAGHAGGDAAEGVKSVRRRLGSGGPHARWAKSPYASREPRSSLRRYASSYPVP